VSALAPTKLMRRTAASMRLTAAKAGTYDGLPTAANMALMQQCHRLVPDGLELVASLTFTRDAGMHTSGWWKNPEYQRCEHLSLCFRDRTGKHESHQRGRGRAWATAFFGEHTHKLWVEPPFSEAGKQADVYHYRLFLAPDWRTPIVPRKEVYSTEFTEVGWKSWSEVHSVPDLLGQKPP